MLKLTEAIKLRPLVDAKGLRTDPELCDELRATPPLFVDSQAHFDPDEGRPASLLHALIGQMPQLHTLDDLFWNHHQTGSVMKLREVAQEVWQANSQLAMRLQSGA
jgi:hypothetical protein